MTQSISLACELALQSNPSPAIEFKLLDIMQQASRAAEITRQLLAFSRRQVLQPHVVNVNDCIRKTMPVITRTVGLDVKVDLRLDETVDRVFIDPEQLAVVMIHLADNARIAMPHGGTLRISTSSAPDALEQGADEKPCTVLTIADTGIGMDSATLHRIFEPFFSTKETSLTSGLGLATVHGIIAQSKGSIECDSAPGQGATFRIYLPIASQKTLPAKSVEKSQPRANLQVLLAEDDAMVNRHLTHALRMAGIQVDSVSNGEEALHALDKHPYQLLITDIIMPRVGGVELTRRLRQQNPRLPVLLISGFTEELSVLQNVPRSLVSYLQKPFSISKFIDTINSLLAASSNAAADPTADFP